MAHDLFISYSRRDNSPTHIARLNGGDWLHILDTTRPGENELPPDDALALIESYQPDGHFHSEAEHDAAREIVRMLGSFTLAVESAAVYLGQFANDVTCAAFVARLKKEGLEGLDIRTESDRADIRDIDFDGRKLLNESCLL